MIGLKQYKEVVSFRHDGTWPLIAAAAGNQTAFNSVVHALRSALLGRCDMDDYPMDPGLLGDHIESIAAANPDYLVKLSLEWKEPSEISSDLHDFQNDLWAEAWAISLRHLKIRDAATLADVSTDNYRITVAAENLWPTAAIKPISWHESLLSAHRGELSYVRSDVALIESAITAEDIFNCRLAYEETQSVFGLFRALRDCSNIVTASGKQAIRRIVEDGIALPPDEMAILAELAFELRFEELDELLSPYAERVIDSKSPRKVLLLALVLLNNGWKLP